MTHEEILATEDLMGYICDEVCIHAKNTDITQEELEDQCAKCKCIAKIRKPKEALREGGNRHDTNGTEKTERM